MDRLKDLSFFELNLLLEASRVRSLRGLARKLDKKPAHLSKSLKRLESKLQLELFKRSANGMQITPEGVRLLPVVEEICELGGKLVGGRASLNREPGRAIGIAAVHFLQLHLSIPVLHELKTDFSHLRFRFVELLPDEFLQHAVAGTFDCAIHMSKMDWPRNWTTKMVGTIRFGLFARADHPLSSECTEPEVLKYPFTIPAYWSEGKFLPGSDFCPAPLSQRKWGHEAASAVTAVETLLHTDALCFVPTIVAARLVAQKRLKEITVDEWPLVERPLHISVHGDRITKPFFKALLKSVASILGAT